LKLSIKRVNGMDIGQLRELAVDFAAETKPEYPHVDETEIDKHMLHVLSTKDDPAMIYLIAYDGKKPVGYFIGYVGSHEWTLPQRVGVAQELYVVPRMRGGKAGFRLMDRAAKIAIDQGALGFECIGMYGTTDKRWEKFGFKPHLTYGHIPLDEFAKIMDKFVGQEKAA
jgi:GNAT superfamily N-acetyltransferase